MAISTVSNVGTTANNPTSLQSSLAITGLASGLNWSTIVTELANAERSPEIQWQNQQATIAAQQAAYSTITSDLTTLQMDSEDLLDPSFFDAVTASSSNSSVASPSVSSGTPAGTYNFNITQLATEAQWNGSTGVSQVLDANGNPSSITLGAAGFSSPVTAGTFTVNGQSVAVATTNSLQQVFDAIAAATNNEVTAAYDPAADKITLTSADGSPITLGSAADTSNFLQVAQLYNADSNNTANTGIITSAGPLGHVSLSSNLSNADLKTPVTDGGTGTGAGSFQINGITFNYNINTDSIQDLLNNINTSNAGVSAAYNSIDNRFVLTNTSTGDAGVALKDVSGNFLAATGLSSGALTHGQNLVATLNGSTQPIISKSNILDSSATGIVGLTVTVAAAGSTSVSVNSDSNTISTAIQKFVSDYNTLESYMASQQKVTTNSAGNPTASTLTGDSVTTDLMTNLRSLMNQVEKITGTSGVVSQLADLGFQSNGNDNTIALSNSSTLTSMLNTHLNDIKALFSDSAKGLAVQMNNYITNAISTDGALVARTSDLTQQSSDITKQISNLETKISNDSAQWDSEFQAMENAESQSNAELKYISQGVSSGSL